MKIFKDVLCTDELTCGHFVSNIRNESIIGVTSLISKKRKCYLYSNTRTQSRRTKTILLQNTARLEGASEFHPEPSCENIGKNKYS